jgi:HK97 family phage portal protein
VIVQSDRQLRLLDGSSTTGGPLSFAGVAAPGITRSTYYQPPQSDIYGRIYAAQPNVRIPIDFLAGNVAQLGLHVFRRVDDTDRQRLNDHQLARWLGKPNPATSQYRLIESLLGDYGVFKNAYWLKLRYYSDEWGEDAIGLLRLPPDQMRIIGGLLPSVFVWTNPYTGQRRDFDPSEIVYFGGYNPIDPLMGLSHLDTLHSVISEDAAASQHRANYWRNASRHEGVIERPKEAPKWTPAQKQSFREQWQQRFAGGDNSGLIAVLEEGMSFKPTAFSPKDSEYIQGGKLRREVTAAEFNVPQPSIGILDHATFSNIKEQHKQLYQDSLGPTLEMVTQEIERQLLIECDDTTNVYLEFNIAAKLAGSFEEQSTALRMLIGRPIMTANEGRARLNLPAMKDDPTADQLAPQQGGPAGAVASPFSTPVPADDTTGTPDGEPDVTDPAESGDAGTSEISMTSLIVKATRARQRIALARYAPIERSSAFFAQIDRWNRELAADLTPVLGADAAARLAIETNVELFTALEALEAVA